MSEENYSASKSKKLDAPCSRITPAKDSPLAEQATRDELNSTLHPDISFTEVIKKKGKKAKKRSGSEEEESDTPERAPKSSKTDSVDPKIQHRYEMQHLPSTMDIVGDLKEPWQRYKEMAKGLTEATRDQLTWYHVVNDASFAYLALWEQARYHEVDLATFYPPADRCIKNPKEFCCTVPIRTLKKWFNEFRDRKLAERAQKRKVIAKRHGWESEGDEDHEYFIERLEEEKGADIGAITPPEKKVVEEEDWPEPAVTKNHPTAHGAVNNPPSALSVTSGNPPVPQSANSHHTDNHAANNLRPEPKAGAIDPQQLVFIQQLECLKSINNNAALKAWCGKVKAAFTGSSYRRDFREIMSGEAISCFNDHLGYEDHPLADGRWLSEPPLEIVKLLYTYASTSQAPIVTDKLATRLREWDFNLDQHPTTGLATQFAESLLRLVNQFGEGYEPPEEQQPSCIAALEEFLKKAAKREEPAKRLGSYVYTSFKELPADLKPRTVVDFRRWAGKLIHAAAKQVMQTERIIGRENIKRERPAAKDNSGGSRQQKQQQKQQQQQQTGTTQEGGAVCNGCGRFIRTGRTCACGPHPDRNKNPQIPFKDSAGYRAQKARGYEYEQLDLKRRADGSELTRDESAAIEKAKSANKQQPSDKKKDFRKKGELQLNALEVIESMPVTELSDDEHDKDFSVFTIYSPYGVSKQVKTLIDSGSLQACFVDEETAEWLASNGGKRRRENVVVNLAVKNSAASSSSSFRFDVSFVNEVNKKVEFITNLEVFVMQSDYELIIGRPTIKKYGLTKKIPSFCEEEGVEPAPIVALARRSDGSPLEIGTQTGTEDNPRAALQATKSRVQLYATAIVLDKTDLIDEYDDSDYIEWPDNPFDMDPREVNSVPFVDRINFQGPTSLQENLRNLCSDYPEIFLEKVQPDPARVTPMSIEVDESMWKTSKHRGPPRIQCRSKEEEIDKQITNYLALGVIRPCKAAEVSQLHLVPKPDPNEWRFCLDFVQLNKCTKGIEGWPIPNISQLLSRIGARKAKFFAIMDLTSGYHQAPIDEKSQVYTAFTCFRGVYCWLRVPMGLKNAASYFQRVMATEVLVGLIHVICELYIDDIIVFGQDEEDYTSNLRSIFTRLREHNVTLNPKKCHFGLEKVQYVGHEIDRHGMSFTHEKRMKVLDFPLPDKKKGLQAFLGLINYFRDHVGDMTSLEHPLRTLITNPKKDYVIQWTEEAKTAFHRAREVVSSCPALFFLSEDPDDKIVVMTDASNYGIGAYIFQLVRGVEKPIIFMSRALHGAELNWSTIEKEAFAIYHTLVKFSHLLRDSKFLLKTDHKNLTYINLAGSQKVARWKIALQEFDYEIEHVEGVKNIVADAFSRLCLQEKTLKLNAIEMNTPIPQAAYDRIAEHHNSTVGHFGVEKTISMLVKGEHRWRGMRNHVRQFVRQCSLCQKISQINPDIKAKRFTTSAYNPMDVLNIDTIGPVAKDNFGNEHIIVVIDCFTRWVELYPVPDTSAISAARALLAHVGRWGVPGTLRSDRGSQFVNEIIKDLSTLLVLEHQTTIAYSKEENATVERANKEVLRHLRAIIFEQKVKENWSMDQLPLVMRILNSEQKKSIGISPAEILFGNTIELSRRILYPAPVEETDDEPKRTLSDHVEKLYEAQTRILKVAQQTQMKNDEFHMSMYDEEYTEFPINSYVLVDPPQGSTGKLDVRRKGPYQVVNADGNKYTLKHLLNNRKEFDIHISKLSPFLFDETRTNPVDVVMNEEQEYKIASVVNHRGDEKRSSTLAFLVKWEGYDEEHDSWEPFHNLKDCEKLHLYLIENNLKRWVPKKYRKNYVA
jgi:transposase InsO family protein